MNVIQKHEKVKIISLILGLSSFLFYLYFLCPGIGFGDTAILIDNIQRTVINSEVNTHPFTILMGKIFLMLPFGELAYRANLLSTFFASLSLMVFFLSLYFLHGRLFISLLSTLSLAFSYSFFWHSTIVENYNISSFITSLSLLFYVLLEKTRKDRYLYILFSLFGLGILNHVQMAFIGPGIGFIFLYYLFQKKEKFRFFLNCLLGFMIGLLPYLLIFFKDVIERKAFFLVLKNAFMGAFGGVFFSQSLAVAIYEFILLYLFQFPNLFLFLVPFGLIVYFKKKDYRMAYAAGLIHFFLNSFFFAFYGTWDKFAFLLQSYILLCFYASFALIYIEEKFIRYRFGIYTLILFSLLSGLYFYKWVHISSQKPGTIWHFRYNNDYSKNLYDQAKYIILPYKRDFTEVEEYCKLVFEKLPKGSVILEDDSRTYYPLADYYQKYYQKRRDIQVLLMNSWGIQNWGLNSDSVVNEIKNSVKRKKAFFLPVLNNPYLPIIKEITKDNHFYFEKFSLSPTRWIYEVKYKNQQTATEKNDKMMDLELKDVSNSKDLYFTRQFMQSFGDTWEFSDQIFASGKPGSSIEFLIERKEDAKESIRIAFSTAPDFSRIDVYWNELRILENMDLYSTEVKRKLEIFDNINIRKGRNILKLIIKDKNPKSGGYKLGIDAIYF